MNTSTETSLSGWNGVRKYCWKSTKRFIALRLRLIGIWLVELGTSIEEKTREGRQETVEEWIDRLRREHKR